MSKKKRTMHGPMHLARPAPARPAPETFPKAIRDCDHAVGPWKVIPTVVTMGHNPQGDPDAAREVVGHCLVIKGMQCLSCGERFRFVNLPNSGDPAQHPVTQNGALEVIMRIEPDNRILLPDASGSRILLPN